MNLKLLFEMFKDGSSHGLFSLQFLCATAIFFGIPISIPKNSITKLYRNLSCETLSDAADIEFEAVPYLVAEMSSQIKKSTLLNTKRKEEQDKKAALTLKNHIIFLINLINSKKD